MKLIITDKPLIAKNIIASIGTGDFVKANGYFENKDYIVTWAFHHLFKLDGLKETMQISDPDTFFESTPISDGFCPDCFVFARKKESMFAEQFETLKTLLSRDDIESVIHAGGFGTDGEIMIRVILHMVKCKVPVKRLWTSNYLCFDSIQDTKALNEFDQLARKGFCNMYKNWVNGNDHPFVGSSPEEQIPISSDERFTGSTFNDTLFNLLESVEFCDVESGQYFRAVAVTTESTGPVVTLRPVE